MMNKKKPTCENYPFWDAYKAVKNGKWTEDDFHIWASSVWRDGANTDLGRPLKITKKRLKKN